MPKKRNQIRQKEPPHPLKKKVPKKYQTSSFQSKKIRQKGKQSRQKKNPPRHTQKKYREKTNGRKKGNQLRQKKVMTKIFQKEIKYGKIKVTVKKKIFDVRCLLLANFVNIESSLS
jgi:hypothetical protein